MPNLQRRNPIKMDSIEAIESLNRKDSNATKKGFIAKSDLGKHFRDGQSRSSTETGSCRVLEQRSKI